MINNIVIVGRLTKDPQIYEKEGKKLATFCVAVNRSYKDKDQNTICDYLYCKAFGYYTLFECDYLYFQHDKSYPSQFQSLEKNSLKSIMNSRIKCILI